MTEPENPDPLGYLIGDPSHGSDAVAYPSRRDLRAEREKAGRRGRAGRERRVTRPRRSASGRRAAASAPAPASARPPAARRSPKPKASLRQRLTGAGTMLLVGGLFACLGLPAYADLGPTELAQERSTPDVAQTLSVQDVAALGVERDEYDATSGADLRRLYRDAIRQQNLDQYMKSGAKALGDDYPWPGELTRNQGGGLSPLGYYYRECVDFVAWRLNRDAGYTSGGWGMPWGYLTPAGGNASQWRYAWRAHGWPSGTTPKVGAVAWFPYNHVAYVSGVLEDGSVVIEEYNGRGTHVYAQRIIDADAAYYLYAPPRP